jgi:uncharacterized coiled-coil DUF342 family protein
MKKIVILIVLAVLNGFVIAACDSGPSEEERIAQQVEGAMQQYQVYAQAYVQQQQAQQGMAEFKEKVQSLQNLVNTQNMTVLNARQTAQQLKALNDPSLAKEIERSEALAKSAAIAAADFQQQLDEIRAQMEPLQKQYDEATKVIEGMQAQAAAAQPAK